MQGHGRRPKIVRAVACAGFVLLAACTSSAGSGEPTPATSVSPATGSAPTTIRVGVFNIENGGVGVDFSKVVEAVKAGGADVLGVEEATGNIPRLANQAGYPFYSVRDQVISKFPILDDPAADGQYLLIELAPGRVVAIENTHLPSAPYGPYWVKRGNKDAAAIQRMERRRKLPSLQPQLDASAKLQAAGIPVFLTGDFNSPSYRDWIPAMVGTRQYLDFTVDWPISHAVEDAGFVDSYRAIYPDPTTNPGITWWAARPDAPGWDPSARDPLDRIDFVYAMNANTTASEIVGERRATDVSVHVDPWPSDHRSVVSTFEVTPGPMPDIVVADTRRVEIGQPLTVTYGGSASGIEVVPAEAGQDAVSTTTAAPAAGAEGASIQIATNEMTPGAYEVRLVDANGKATSSFPFWAVEPGAKPIVMTDAKTYGVGDPILVSWSQAYGQRWDWIGIYHRGADPNIAYYLVWDYTKASIVGSLPIDEASNGRWPLKAGEYSVYLLGDDGYVKEGGADFTIK